MNRFYVYVYLDPLIPGRFEYDDFCFYYQPFYVGKGTGDRINSHIFEARNFYDHKIKPGGTYKCNKIRKIINLCNHEPYKIIIENNTNESKAFNIEKKLINEIGRLDLKRGPLLNLTDGGDGTSGYKYPDYLRRLRSEAIIGELNHNYGKSHSIDHKSKISTSLSGKNNPNYGQSEKFSGTRNSMFGKKHSDETKEKISKSNSGINNANFGKRFTLQHRKNLSESLKNSNKLKMPRPDLQGRNHPSSKRVLAENKIFDTLKEAGLHLDVDPTTISNRIKSNREGYKFL
ncbi:hypothetical protein KAR91_24905 [Candidatus Pacearchaeota archaeon]|nr:hypothetical protein [Candidatus Pacearchaeota archaeon]